MKKLRKFLGCIAGQPVDTRSPRYLKNNAPDEVDQLTSCGEKLSDLRYRAWQEYGDVPPEIVAMLQKEKENGF
jgi:hypothetical protein